VVHAFGISFTDQAGDSCRCRITKSSDELWAQALSINSQAQFEIGFVIIESQLVSNGLRLLPAAGIPMQTVHELVPEFG
jgi:hypothetical protein